MGYITETTGYVIASYLTKTFVLISPFSLSLSLFLSLSLPLALSLSLIALLPPTPPSPQVPSEDIALLQGLRRHLEASLIENKGGGGLPRVLVKIMHGMHAPWSGLPDGWTYEEVRRR